MADVQGTNYALAWGTTPPDRIPASVYRGRVRVLYDEYEASAAAAGTDILLGKLKEGARILDWFILTDDLGTNVTLQLATRDEDSAATENVFSSAIDVASAAAVSRPVAADIARLPLLVDEDVEVIAKIAGGAATGTIRVFIFYAED